MSISINKEEKEKPKDEQKTDRLMEEILDFIVDLFNPSNDEGFDLLELLIDT